MSGTTRPIPEGDAFWRRDMEKRLRDLERNSTSGVYAGGTGDLSAVFVQDNPAALWDIHHGLGKYPSVTVVDSAGTEIITTVVYIDADHLQVKFAGSTAGKAYLN